MSNIQRKQTENFVVIFLQEGATQFSKVKISIPTYKKVKQIYQYLQKQKTNPFKNFFITNKLKERAQFTEEKEIKEIKEEFKKDKNGNYVILCYEDKTKNAEEKVNAQGESSKEAKDTKDKKDDKDSNCIIM